MKRYALVGAALVLAALSSGTGAVQARQAPAAGAVPKTAAPAKPSPAPTSGAVSSQAPAMAASHGGESPAPHRELLDKYCVTCHNQRTKLAGVMFDTVSLAELPEHADIWEKTLRKLRAGMMPPPGARQPEAASVEAFATWLETSLDRAAAASPDPGRVALHRLNRTEYGNAVEELLGVRVDASALLPKDDEADGFDNMATALRVSPSFIDQYVAAARMVTIKAIGVPSPKPESAVSTLR